MTSFDRAPNYADFDGKTVIDMPRTGVVDEETGEVVKHDDWTVEVKALAVHTGDYQPVRLLEVAKLKKKGQHIELMQLPIEFVDLTCRRRNWDNYGCDRVLPGQLKEPIQETWSDVYAEEMAQKESYLGKTLHMFYILDSGELSEGKAASRITNSVSEFDRPYRSTDSHGREYWFRTRGNLGGSGSSWSTSVSDMYASNEAAAAHWCNTH